MSGGGIKHWGKRIIHRLMRPGLAPMTQRIEALEGRLADMASKVEAVSQRTEESLAMTRSVPDRLSRVEDVLERVAAIRVERDKHREELAYWRWLIKTEAGRKSLFAPFDVAFGRWQRDRLRELGEALGLEREGESIDRSIDGWCSEQSVVEIGAGPYPAVAAAPRWRRAVAIDPLARSYAEEGLLPAAANHVTYLESPGEHIPLPGGFADLVIIENALDHVSDPALVLLEIRRLLREEGLLWLLVDLSNYSDHMHPHPFNEQRARELLAAAGFEVVTDRVSTHKSHPKAYGEYRGLLRKASMPPPEVVVVHKAETSAHSG